MTTLNENLKEEEYLTMGLYHLMEPLSNEYDTHIRAIQLSQTDLAQKIDYISEELEKFINMTDESFLNVKTQITKLANSRKKLVSTYNTLGIIHERMDKMKKLIDKKYPFLSQIFDTFGVDLNEIMKRKNEPEDSPKIVINLIKRIREIGLEKHGLFRVPGDTKEIAKLKKKFNQLNDVDLSEYNDIFNLGSLLKLYLRELPNPVCKHEFYHEFIAVSKLEDGKSEALKSVIHNLPEVNRNLLKRVMHLASDIEKTDGNEMDAKNLSICLAINILSSDKLAPQEAMLDHQNVLSVIQTMIENYDQIFD
eukprot:gene9353-1440_t